MLFRDAARQAEFDESGYVVLDLVDSSGVERLLELYRETVADNSMVDIFESAEHCPLEKNLRIMGGVREVFAERASQYFGEGTLFGGNFLIKSPEKSTQLGLHQDWNVVDEAHYQSALIWCALVDVTPENGGLYFLPGSHHFFQRHLRSGSMPSPRIAPEGPLADLVVDVSLRPGQALAWADGLFHGSRPNRTGERRLVCTGRFNQAGAELIYYQQEGEDRVSLVQVDPEWWLTDHANLNEGQVHQGSQVRETFDYRYRPVTGEVLLERLAELGRLPAGERSEARSA